jgi:hypothetical protein
MKWAGNCVLGALLATLWGCGSGSATLVPVEGFVTLDGVPVAGAMVTLHPEAEQGTVATGLTDSDGAFQLQTHAAADGALPGNYKVTVTKTEAVAAAPKDPAKQKEWMMKMMFNRGAKKARDSALPREYGDASKTPLRVRVPHEGQLKLELKKSGGA